MRGELIDDMSITRGRARLRPSRDPLGLTRRFALPSLALRADQGRGLPVDVRWEAGAFHGELFRQ